MPLSALIDALDKSAALLLREGDEANSRLLTALSIKIDLMDLYEGGIKKNDLVRIVERVSGISGSAGSR